MNKESPEKTVDVFEDNYQRYLELGGIINEKDCQSALDRMGKVLDETEPSVRASISQAKGIAEHAGIKLRGSIDSLDPKIVLYVILRLDINPEGVKYHHSQMSDQRIFGEVLRMLGDIDSLEKLIKAYPNISFKYERGE